MTTGSSTDSGRAGDKVNMKGGTQMTTKGTDSLPPSPSRVEPPAHRPPRPPGSAMPGPRPQGSPMRSEERREGKSVDLGGRRIIKKKNDKIMSIKRIATHIDSTRSAHDLR